VRQGIPEVVALREVLSQPFVAALLGFLIGSALIVATAWSRRFSTSSDASDSVAIMMGFMMGGMLLATAVLIAYVFVAPQGFLYFGLSLATGFVVGLAVMAVVMGRETFRD